MKTQLIIIMIACGLLGLQTLAQEGNPMNGDAIEMLPDQAVADAELNLKIAHALHQDLPLRGIGSMVRITAKKGHVTITGMVVNTWTANRVLNRVSDVPGVTSVTSELKVMHQSATAPADSKDENESNQNRR